MQLIINGQTKDVDVEAEMPLLWVLRDVLNLTGTKFGCGVSACGACTVLVDGVAMRSCSVPASSVAGASITTIEAQTMPDTLQSRVQAAWIAHQVPQCGYCQSGQIMAAVALLSENQAPSDADIDAAMSNICRCGTYGRVRAAIHSLKTV
ncbi:MAG: isoquinoline 1-oxidoreductase subunit alpha [Alphaproteobacteria bacterium]|nr:isoquinoline 1-oxidoreductase subunit alpha [Alphaproteobacteria bacterium]